MNPRHAATSFVIGQCGFVRHEESAITGAETLFTGDETPREVKWLPRPVRELRLR
jgi:hypothetical protein